MIRSLAIFEIPKSGTIYQSVEEARVMKVGMRAMLGN